jgi:tetratricopeptide (TPR) repeat protein
MRRNSLVLSLILSASVAIAHPPAGIAQSARENSEARKLFNEGNEQYADRNFAEAERKFREALTKYPKAEQSDRTTYYLILTLEQLKRVKDALTEIQNFHKNYPASTWRQDVDDKSLELGILKIGGLELTPWTRSQEKKLLQPRADLPQQIPSGVAFPVGFECK